MVSKSEKHWGDKPPVEVGHPFTEALTYREVKMIVMQRLIKVVRMLQRSPRAGDKGAWSDRWRWR